jgi:hypothetical protein
MSRGVAGITRGGLSGQRRHQILRLRAVLERETVLERGRAMTGCRVRLRACPAPNVRRRRSRESL